MAAISPHECNKPSVKEGGFSLIELLVVVAIMAVLAGVGFPLAELSHQRALEEDLRRSLRDIRGALDSYRRLVDEGRIARSADSSGYPPRLEVLVDGVTDATSPQGAKIYLLRSLPRDPFASKEVGQSQDTWAIRSYASSSENPSPGKDVFDVHSKFEGVGLNGVPYRAW
jgi:general secretion pathway protein G